MARVLPPIDLDQSLHPEFHRLVLQLGALASMVDPVMLGRLVKARAEETMLSARIDREGLTVRGARGIVKNPLLPQLSRVRQQVARLEASTGVDLNARKRITGKVVRPGDEAVESDTDFLMRLYFSTSEPSAEDMPRLERLAAEGKARTKAAKRRLRRG